MSFGLDVWKEKATDYLSSLRTRVAQRTVPHMLYATLCGAALWPLVEAYQQGETLPVLMALGNVVAGVGGNLLAEQVQRWQDRADEEAVAAWVAAEAPENEALRTALDAILERVEAIEEVRTGLREADRSWFDRQLQGELARLGNLERYAARLEGSGALAQGAGALAVGAGGVHVGGNVGGDIVTGRKSTVFDQREQEVEAQQNVAGDYHDNRQMGTTYTVNIEKAEGLAIGNGAQVVRSDQLRAPDRPSATADLATLRPQLQQKDDVALDTLCMDHFPDVYDQFGRGQRRDEKINQLLDHCRRNPTAAARLTALLRGNA